jgi:hypothetical protein
MRKLLAFLASFVFGAVLAFRLPSGRKKKGV